MARLFASGASQYLAVAQAIVSGPPFTMAARFNVTDLTGDHLLLSVADVDDTNYYALYANGSRAGDPVAAQCWDGAHHKAESTVGYTANTWHHACGVWAADDDRRAYIDGGNKGTNTDSAVVANLDNCRVGVSADSTPWGYCNGAVAEAAIWNVALTDAEVAILGEGFSPLFVRPQNLVAYWPLIRDEDQDRVGGYDLTAFNTPGIAVHPPMLYPAPPIFAFGAAAVAARIPRYGFTNFQVPGMV